MYTNSKFSSTITLEGVEQQNTIAFHNHGGLFNHSNNIHESITLIYKNNTTLGTKRPEFHYQLCQ